ncbi:MAG: pirin family protein [Burkholderiaceae bacterium]
MRELIKSSDRGYADHGWLKSFHSFSFANYHNPKRMGFGPLRVINEDRIAGGTGFGTHGHRDMEIISYVLSGELAHQDSMGNGKPGGENAGVIRPGDVQRMSAGTGVMHSEFNHSKDGETHFLQIWVMPDQQGVTPGYEQKHFSDAEKRGKLRLVASPDGALNSVTLHQDARLYAGLFNGAERAELPLNAGRLTYLHVVKGTVTANGEVMHAGDALQMAKEEVLTLDQGDNAEVLVFDLPV